MGRSNILAGIQPPDGPPVCTALIFTLPTGPPPMPLMISSMVMPIGTSTKPVFLILPTRLNILVPELFFVPIFANSGAPRSMMTGMFAQVSTLLMAVGLPSIPFCTGNGGRWRGSPIFPSTDCINAVSSPHTNAPAPLTRLMSKENWVPRMFSPRSPSSRACRSAMIRCLMANGYSLRT